jgi:hypothetical protein
MAKVPFALCILWVRFNRSKIAITNVKNLREPLMAATSQLVFASHTGHGTEQCAIGYGRSRRQPRLIVPAHRSTTGRPMARHVSGCGETCDWEHPCCFSETNGMLGASEYGVRLDGAHPTPLVGLTYLARTRYRLAGRRLAGETLPTETCDRPAVRRWEPHALGWGGYY